MPRTIRTFVRLCFLHTLSSAAMHPMPSYHTHNAHYHMNTITICYHHMYTINNVWAIMYVMIACYHYRCCWNVQIIVVTSTRCVYIVIFMHSSVWEGCSGKLLLLLLIWTDAALSAVRTRGWSPKTEGSFHQYCVNCRNMWYICVQGK